MDFFDVISSMSEEKLFIIICDDSESRKTIHQYLESKGIFWKTSMISNLFNREVKLCIQKTTCFKCYDDNVKQIIGSNVITGTCKECGYRFAFKNDWGTDYTEHLPHCYNETVRPIWKNNMIVIGPYLNANRSKPNHAVSNNSITEEEIAEIMKDLKTFEIEIDFSFCSSNKKLSDKKIQNHINHKLKNLLMS